jgi:hypothetical protein
VKAPLAWPNSSLASSSSVSVGQLIVTKGRSRRARHDLAHGAHRGRSRLEVGLGRLGLQALLQIGDARRERALHGDLLEQVPDLRRRERLRQVVPRAAPDGVHGRLDRGVGGHDDDDDVGVLGEQLRDEIEAARRAEPQIEEDDVEHGAADRLERRRRRARLRDLGAERLEAHAQRLPDVLFVVDDEDRELTHPNSLPRGFRFVARRRPCKPQGPCASLLALVAQP